MTERVCERDGCSQLLSDHVHPARLAVARFHSDACRAASRREDLADGTSPEPPPREEVGVLTEGQARSLTDEVKRDAAALWSKLLVLYEGGAHAALGYSSWGAFYEAEFGRSGNYGYRLLKSAEVMAQLPTGNSQPASERVARELVPVLRDDPERVEGVWAGVVEEHGPAPTAAQVREIVRAPAATPAAVPVDQCVVPPGLQAALRSEFTIVGRAAVRDGVVDVGSGGVRWINPPSREAARWVRAASEYASRPGCVAVCIIPVDTTAAWWWDYCRAAEVRFLREPLVWHQAGEALAPVAAAVVIFGARRASVRWWDLPAPSAQAETLERAPVDGEVDSEAGSAPAEGADAELARLVAKFPETGA